MKTSIYKDFFTKLSNRIKHIQFNNYEENVFLNPAYLYYNTEYLKKSSFFERDNTKSEKYLKNKIIFQCDVENEYTLEKLKDLNCVCYIISSQSEKDRIWVVLDPATKYAPLSESVYSLIQRIYLGKSCSDYSYISDNSKFSKFLNELTDLTVLENENFVKIDLERVIKIHSYIVYNIGYGKINQVEAFNKINLCTIFFSSLSRDENSNAMYSSIALSKTKKERDSLKMELSSYLFSISGNSKRNLASIREGLTTGKTSLNPFVIVDIDFKDIKTDEKVETLFERNEVAQKVKEALFNNLEYVSAAFISPSFEGVKLLVKLDYKKVASNTPLTFDRIGTDYTKIMKFVFAEIEKDIAKIPFLNYQIKVDMSCSDVSRAHYEFYDPGFKVRHLDKVKAFEKVYEESITEKRKLKSIFNEQGLDSRTLIESGKYDIKEKSKKNVIEHLRDLQIYQIYGGEDLSKIHFVTDEDIEAIEALVEILPDRFPDHVELTSFQYWRAITWNIQYLTNNYAYDALKARYPGDDFDSYKSSKLENINLMQALLRLKTFVYDNFPEHKRTYLNFQKAVCNQFPYYTLKKKVVTEPKKITLENTDRIKAFQTDLYKVPFELWSRFIEGLPKDAPSLTICNSKYIDSYNTSKNKLIDSNTKLEKQLERKDLGKAKETEIRGQISDNNIRLDYIESKHAVFKDSSFKNLAKAVYTIGGPDAWTLFRAKFETFVNGPNFEPGYLEEFSIARFYDYIEFFCFLMLSETEYRDKTGYDKLLGFLKSTYDIKYSVNDNVSFNTKFVCQDVEYFYDYSEPDNFLVPPENVYYKNYQFVVDTEFTNVGSEESSLKPRFDKCLDPVEKAEDGEYKMYKTTSPAQIEVYRSRIKECTVGQSLVISAQSKVVNLDQGKFYSNFLESYPTYEDCAVFDTQWDGQYRFAQSFYNYSWVIEKLIYLRDSTVKGEEKQEIIDTLNSDLVEFIIKKCQSSKTKKYGGYRRFTFFGHAVETDFYKVFNPKSKVYNLVTLLGDAGYMSTEFKVLKCISKKGILPIVIEKEDYIYIMQVDFKETTRLGGVPYSYEKFANVVNVSVPFKDMFKDNPSEPPEYGNKKARMLEMALTRKDDFEKYALGDLRCDDFYVEWGLKMLETCLSTCRKFGQYYLRLGEKISAEEMEKRAQQAYNFAKNYFYKNFKLGSTIGSTIETFIVIFLKTYVRLELEVYYPVLAPNCPSLEAFKTLYNNYISFINEEITEYNKTAPKRKNKSLREAKYYYFNPSSVSLVEFKLLKEDTNKKKEELVDFIFKRYFGAASVKNMLKNVDLYESPDHLLAFGTKTIGGRSFNNRPLTLHEQGLLVDMDLQSCYASGMSMLKYFIGAQPTIEHTGVSKEKDLPEHRMKNLQLKTFLKKEAHLEKFWFAYVDISELLPEAQDFLLSHSVSNAEINKVAKKDSHQKRLKEYNNSIKKAGVTSIYSKKLSGNMRSSNNEDKSKHTTLAYISHFELDFIMKRFSPELKKHVLENAYIISVSYYKKDNVVGDTISFLNRVFSGDKGVVLAIDFGRHLVNSLKELRNDMKAKVKYYKKEGDKEKEEMYNSMQEVAKCVNNSIYGVMVSIFYNVGNPIISNFITSAARCYVYLLEKVLFVLQTITDGGVFNINRVLHPRKNIRKLTTKHFVNLDENVRSDKNFLKDNNIRLAPVSHFTPEREIEYSLIEPVYLDVPSSNGSSKELHIKFNGVLESDTKILSCSEAEEYVNEICLRYIEHHFSDLEIVKEQVFKLEMKGFTSDCYTHGKADYMLTALEKKEGSKIWTHSAHLQAKVRGYKKVPALQDYFTQLRHPEKVKRIKPVMIDYWLRPGRKNTYSKFLGNNNYQLGDFVKDIKQFKEFSIGQYKFQSYQQHQNFKNIVWKLTDKLGQSFELLYSYFEKNENGDYDFFIDIERMNRELHEHIIRGGTPKTLFAKKGINSIETYIKDVREDKSKSHIYEIEHPYYEELKLLRTFKSENVQLSVLEDYISDAELEDMGVEDFDTYIDLDEEVDRSSS